MNNPRNTITQKNKSNKKRGNGKNRGNASKNQRGPKPREFEINVDDSKINAADLPHVITDSKSDNDPKWYTNIPSLSNTVANIYMSDVSGLTFDSMNQTGTFTADGSPVIYGTSLNTFPGIMSFKMAPTYGPADNPGSALNVAAEQLYNLTRKENSGARNYDKTDLMSLVIGMDNAYMLYEHLVRAYRLLATYDADNRYYPDTLLQALGFNASDLRANYADFRATVDLFAYRLASINIPDQFDIIKRHSWLFSNVYRDAAETKSQLYAFVPYGLYVWNEANMTDDNPVILHFTAMSDLYGMGDNPTLATLTHITTAIDTIMSPLMGSEDVGVISGDLAKAFGQNGMISFRQVTDNEPLYPVYSAEVLSEIENMNYLDAALFTMDISYNASNLSTGPYLSYQPTCSSVYRFPHFRRTLLNFHKADVTVEDVMVATRFTFNMDQAPVGNRIPIRDFGSEIVVTASVWLLGSKFTPSETRFQQDVIVSSNTTFGLTVSNLARECTKWTKFDWAPTVYMWNCTVGGTTAPKLASADLWGTLCDIDNYTWMDATTVRKINNVAIMSMLKVKDYPTNL